MADELKTSMENIWHKVIAGVFAAVVAPVLVAFGIKFTDKVMTPPTPPAVAATATPAVPTATTAPATAATAAPPAVAPAAPVPPAAITSVAATAPATATAPPAATAASDQVASASTPPASTPPADQVTMPTFKKPSSPVQRLFNGRDLTGFYTYLGRPHPKAKPYGKSYDPDRVFSVEGGLLHVSGQMLGVLETEKEYSDYWLTVEYKWGEKTWPPDEEAARRSAIMLNIQGPDGVVRGVCPSSFHAQLMEGSTGDFLVSAGQGDEHYSLTAPVEEKHLGKQTLAFYTPRAPRTTFTQGLIKRYPPGHAGKDVKGYHPIGDLERPVGEWNTLECVVLNGKILVRLNDHVVNFATDVTPAGGRIGIQSHGAEIYFREITLQPYLKHHVAQADADN